MHDVGRANMNVLRMFSGIRMMILERYWMLGRSKRLRVGIDLDGFGQRA